MMQSAAHYEDRPIRQTHPRVLADAARRLGLEAAPPNAAQVLEFGCAHGVNLLAMAARLPSASFVGVDIDEHAIGVARRRARDAGVTNVRFEAIDLADFDSGPECFDYVIAHGVLSWVQRCTGDALLASIASLLSPVGIGYVSYDTKPGASMRDALGLGLRASPHIERAMQLLGDSPALAGTHPGAWLRAEVEAALARPRSFIDRQFLGAVQQAFSVGEVWDWAQRHALHYVADVADTGLPADLVRETATRVETLTTCRRDAEQLLDVALMRQFRATLFSRRQPGPALAEVPRPEYPDVSVPTRPRTLPLTRLEARELGFVSTPQLDARALHPLHALLIEHSDGVQDHDALADIVVASVRRGTLVLPSASGAPATAAEVEHGARTVVADAVRDLARAGIVFS